MADTEKTTTEQYYDFQYLPLEGRLPGKSFEAQTERAINDLGDRVVTVEIEAGDASALAKTAYDTAVSAETTANKAQTTADEAAAAAANAQATADSAQAAANAAQSTADGAYEIAVEARDTANNAKSVADAANETATAAQTTANDAYAMAQTAETTAENAATTATAAQETANAASETATAAESTANQAELEASTALTTANSNTEKIVSLQQDVDEMKAYTVVGTVDLNDYYTEFARLYVDADSDHAPTDTEKYFVDVDVNSDMTQVRQIATGAASGEIWIRYGALTENEEPETEEGAGEGTLVINGDLSADIKVRGSVQVSGEISGNVEATGTITYGTLTGTVSEGATLDEVDIAVDAGTLTVQAGDLSTEDGVLSSSSGVLSSSGTDATIYSDLKTYEPSGRENALYISGGKVTIDEGATVTATGTNTTENYGTYINNGELVVAGVLNTIGTEASDYNTGFYVGANGTLTVTETGEVNASCAEDVEEKHNCFSIWTQSGATIEVNGTINATGETWLRSDFTGTGEVYINGELYYDGGGSSGYTVEWGEWIEIGTGAVDIATDDEVEERLQAVFGITID